MVLMSWRFDLSVAVMGFCGRKVGDCEVIHKRFCYDDILWTDRLIGLKGARGVGKTTLLLQKIRESGDEAASTLYVSLDSVWLDAKELYGLAEYHVQHNGTRLVLDARLGGLRGARGLGRRSAAQGDCGSRAARRIRQESRKRKSSRGIHGDAPHKTLKNGPCGGFARPLAKAARGGLPGWRRCACALRCDFKPWHLTTLHL